MRAEHGNGNGHGRSLAIEAQRLMPTPTGRDSKGRNQRDDDTCLPGAVALLPTPTAQDAASSSGANPDWGHGTTLTDAARNSTVNWGEYTPAIQRWRHFLGRPAPHPTEPGRNGKPRLSPRFTEWMMGLPEGWVTDVDIPTAAQHTALGNGIVPQQMALAIRLLLDDGWPS